MNYINESGLNINCSHLKNHIFKNCSIEYMRVESITNCIFENCIFNDKFDHINISYIDSFSEKYIKQCKQFIVPEGELIVYKKLANRDSISHRRTICKLLIPADAKRSNAFSRKCRASKALVLERRGYSNHDTHFIYKVNEWVKPKYEFDSRWYRECASGIHFFMTKKEAINY